MLKELTVTNLGTVDSTVLEFSPGLSIISGETGAGKSMLLNGVRLLTGGRADASLVRAGALKADVTGVWSIESSRTLKLLASEGVELEDDELYLNRFVKQDGKSRLSVAGVLRPTSNMSELASRLIQIHGQAGQLKLKDPKQQRLIVDHYGGELVSKAYEAYSVKYSELKNALARLSALEQNSSKREFEHRYNEDLVKRFTALAPEVDELETLEAELNKIAHIEDISETLREVLAIISPEEIDSPAGLLTQAANMLHKASKHDEELSHIADILTKSIAELESSLDEIEGYANNIDVESLHRLHELEDRAQDLRVFAKPFGGSLASAIDASYLAEKAIAVYELDDSELLNETVTTLQKEVEVLAKDLTKARKSAARELAFAVSEELDGLAMKSTRMVIDFTEQAFASSGADEISFMIETNNASKRSLTKAASGGELSRIMLALEVVIADASERTTFVFDEIDAGVGGATAIELGRRLALLAKAHQVIVVTHSAQIAAYGDSHFVVTKDELSETVTTSVTQVKAQARVKELARMLSGLDKTDSGLAHARELLTRATDEKESFS